MPGAHGGLRGVRELVRASDKAPEEAAGPEQLPCSLGPEQRRAAERSGGSRLCCPDSDEHTTVSGRKIVG